MRYFVVLCVLVCAGCGRDEISRQVESLKVEEPVNVEEVPVAFVPFRNARACYELPLRYGWKEPFGRVWTDHGLGYFYLYERETFRPVKVGVEEVPSDVSWSFSGTNSQMRKVKVIAYCPFTGGDEVTLEVFWEAVDAMVEEWGLDKSLDLKSIPLSGTERTVDGDGYSIRVERAPLNLKINGFSLTWEIESK